MGVSRHHAVFEDRDGRWIVKDNQSANGTFVNGLRANVYPLHNSDRIKVGATVLIYVAGADPLDTVTEKDRLSTPLDERILVTLLFTDIVSSTEQANKLGDLEWKSLLDQHDNVAKEQVHRFRGRFIKQTGDGLLACFDSPARAVRCACAIRDGVRSIGIDVRSGLHIGEVELRGDDVSGMAVHVAARVADLAGPGQVFVSDSMPMLVAGSGIVFATQGEHELKGIPGSWRISSVEG